MTVGLVGTKNLIMTLMWVRWWTDAGPSWMMHYFPVRVLLVFWFCTLDSDHPGATSAPPSPPSEYDEECRQGSVKTKDLLRELRKVRCKDASSHGSACNQTIASMIKITESLAEERDRKEAFIRRRASLGADRICESQKASENKIRDQAEAIADLKSQLRNAGEKRVIFVEFLYIFSENDFREGWCHFREGQGHWTSQKREGWLPYWSDQIWRKVPQNSWEVYLTQKSGS